MDMGNTVGSREPLVVITARKQQKLVVHPRQLEILKGSILGDAYVTRRGQIQIEHSVKQREYLMWKYRELASISYRGEPAFVQRRDQRNGAVYESMRFWTRQFFRSLRCQFYQDGRKIFPANLQLTPLMLAVWYMDDGHFERKKRRCILATDNFSQDNIMQIQTTLRSQFSLQTIVRKSGKLVFAGENCDKFLRIFSCHVIQTMSYKIH